MDTFNLKDAADQSLRLLEQSGVSAKAVKKYRTTGFGAIIRHFTCQGIVDVNIGMLDAFILIQRECFEQGEFSEWKWRQVRRGSELIKHFVQTGTVDLSALRPWNPVLRKPHQSLELDEPTPAQLADPNDIFALVWRVRQALLKMGLTKNIVRHYTAEGLSVILRRHTLQGLERYLRAFHPNEPADSEKPLFYTIIHGIQQQMSADTVALFLKKYGKIAHNSCPEVPAHIHAHMLRHTRAMHLYHQGMPMMLLSEYLGHASEETTKIYAYADTEMKRAAIDKADIVRNETPQSVPTWIDDEEMILKLSGLI